MKPTAEEILKHIPGPMPGTYLSVQESFADGRVTVQVHYNRHVAITLDLQAFDCSEGKALDVLCVAAREAFEQLRDEVRRDVL